MKLSLKQALISAVVVLAGVSLFIPVASSFAVAPQAQTAPLSQPATTPAPATNTTRAPAPSSTTPAVTLTPAATSNPKTTTKPTNITNTRCEGGALGWILCPVIKLGQDFVGLLEKLIVTQLDMGPLQTTGRYNNLHTAWSGFRDLANVFFIGLFMVIIFAQTLNIKMDSYSIKMMLPRLIVAAVAIQFSFFIMQIGIDISNIIGNGISGVFADVVRAGTEGGRSMSSAWALGSLTIVGGAGAAAVGTTILTGMIVPFILIILAASISMLGVIITVWLRVLLLQMLVLLAPLAIVAWVMPNTQKWFDAWKTNTIKLLLMYPIIMFMISAGALATHVTAISAETGSFGKLLGACIPILVFFMIPTAIKASGSLMNLTGNLVMGRMNNYSKAVRSSSLMQNSKADIKKKAGLMMMENAKNAEGITTFGQKSKALVRRNVGRQLTGNTFSYGKAGRLKIAQSIQHAHHAVGEEYAVWMEQEGFTNPELLTMARAGLVEHKDSVPVTNGYGQKRRVKINHHLAEAAATQMIKQQGMVEFSELMDGVKVKDANGNETLRSGTGLYDHQTNQWRSKDIQKTIMRAIGPNAGKVLEKITHAVHLQGDKAYGDLKGDGVASLGAGSGITAATQGVKWNRINALNAVKDIVNSGALASRAQNDVLKSYRRELLKAYDDGKFEGFEFDIKGYGKMDVGKFLNTFISEGGQVTQVVQGDIKQDADAFNRILRAVLEEQVGLQSQIENARESMNDNPGHH